METRVEIATNEYGMEARIKLSWESVCRQFLEKFEEQFQGKRKAHFDTTPSDLRTVDGAKGKWTFLVMLDAIVYILDNDNLGLSRRFFHQQRVLTDSIVRELSLGELRATELLGGETVVWKALLDVSVDTPPYPWDSVSSFRKFHGDHSPTKAKKKFMSVLDCLLDSSVLRECHYDLPRILNKVILKVMSWKGRLDGSMPQEARKPRSMSETSVPRFDFLLPRGRDMPFLGVSSSEVLGRVPILQAPPSIRSTTVHPSIFLDTDINSPSAIASSSSSEKIGNSNDSCTHFDSVGEDEDMETQWSAFVQDFALNGPPSNSDNGPNLMLSFTGTFGDELQCDDQFLCMDVDGLDNVIGGLSNADRSVPKTPHSMRPRHVTVETTQSADSVAVLW